MSAHADVDLEAFNWFPGSYWGVSVELSQLSTANNGHRLAMSAELFRWPALCVWSRPAISVCGTAWLSARTSIVRITKRLLKPLSHHTNWTELEFANGLDQPDGNARDIRLGVYASDDPTPSQRAADRDDNLFANILGSLQHVLHAFLPHGQNWS